MQIRAIKTRIFKEREPLLLFLHRYVGKPAEQSILVVTSKIVALAEGRVIEKTNTNKINLIRTESSLATPTKHTWLTIKDGLFMASAGIDESNANGKFILLPRDSFKTTQKIRASFQRRYHLKKFGVIITDSRCIPLRAGVVGMALGYAGFQGLKDYRGMPDIFGRLLTISRVNVADSLATAAVYCMGEADEQQPIAIIHNSHVVWTNRIKKHEMVIAPHDDMYAPLIVPLLKK